MDYAYRYSRDDYTSHWNLDMLPDNPEYSKYMRHAVCDDQGHFRFESVADGRYYVFSEMTYLSAGRAHSGGGLLREVSVSGGQTQTVHLVKNLAQEPKKLGGK
jgi:hypothetical protein